jgi:predicted transcriptional regulator
MICTMAVRKLRGKLDIIGDILRLCSSAGRLRKTHIMQKANLSPIMTRDYLTMMLSNRLVDWEDGHFKATEKGIITLKYYQKLVEMSN